MIHWVSDDYSFVDLRPPVSRNTLTNLDARCKRIQVTTFVPTDEEYEHLGELLAAYPDVMLRVHNHTGIYDLQFLRYFRKLRSISLDCWSLENIDGLDYLSSNLTELYLGITKSKRHSLSRIRRFDSLKTLGIEGWQKDISVVGEMVSLRRLMLSSLKLDGLRLLRRLHQLSTLCISLGSTTSLDGLALLTSLQKLTLVMVRGVSDLSDISCLTSLQHLRIECLKHVTRLPELADLLHLKSVEIVGMKQISSIGSLAANNNLIAMNIFGCENLELNDIRAFIGHPSLERASIGFRSLRICAVASQILHLPPTHLADMELEDEAV